MDKAPPEGRPSGKFYEETGPCGSVGDFLLSRPIGGIEAMNKGPGLRRLCGSVDVPSEDRSSGNLYEDTGPC